VLKQDKLLLQDHTLSQSVKVVVVLVVIVVVMVVIAVLME
tara:strand:- start:362 stop:481 length:120 start_codon:yes stop_codon:yes gene_type:complete